MSEVAAATALLLAGVFAWAGAAKLVTPEATATAFAGLGVPRPRLFARAVPLAEFCLAAVLVAWPRAGALLALVLLAVFSAVLAERLRAGDATVCGCFGSGRRQPVSVVDLGRNGLLAVAAVVVAAVGAPVGSGLPAFVVVTGTAATAAVALAMLEVRVSTGRLWDNRLAVGPRARP